MGALVLLSINEASFYESSQAKIKIVEAERALHSVAKLTQTMLDAETGTRGYLLTGDPSYLAPYELANNELDRHLSQLRELLVNTPGALQEFELMAHHITQKQVGLEMDVRMRTEDNNAAWKFMLATGAGQDNMDLIRQQSGKLMAVSHTKMETAYNKISRSLLLSRIGIAAMALCGLLAFYMYLLQTKALLAAGQREQELLHLERDQLEKQVRERTATLAELATHLQEVREDERRHLARELHDELGSLLTAAKLDVARIKSRLGNNMPEATERLEHLTRTLNSGIALKRRIVEDLHPSSLTHLGLKPALEILAGEFADSSGLDIQTSLDQVALSSSAQLTSYRLVQESLTNMGKYAMATQAQIRLVSEADCVRIEVQDNGIGFDVAQVATSHHGLAGMRHRVEAAGGQLVVTSAQGRGTCIQARLPHTS